MGLEEDPEAAFRWHLASAKAGNPIGALSVAVEYRFGIGTRQDWGAAERWLVISPKGTRPADVASPTLERTKSPMGPIPQEVLRSVQNTSIDDPPYGLIAFKDLHPPIRPFRDITVRLKSKGD
jgi:hypothetical protein